MQATQIRPGMVIKYNNDLYSIFSMVHRTPGNLRAMVQAKLKNLRTGNNFEHRFRAADTIEKASITLSIKKATPRSLRSSPMLWFSSSASRADAKAS